MTTMTMAAAQSDDLALAAPLAALHLQRPSLPWALALAAAPMLAPCLDLPVARERAAAQGNTMGICLAMGQVLVLGLQVQVLAATATLTTLEGQPLRAGLLAMMIATPVQGAEGMGRAITGLAAAHRQLLQADTTRNVPGLWVVVANSFTMMRMAATAKLTARAAPAAAAQRLLPRQAGGAEQVAGDTRMMRTHLAAPLDREPTAASVQAATGREGAPTALLG